MNPRTKHFAQVVARAKGLTFGALIEKLLSEYLADETVSEQGRSKRVSDVMKETWSEFAADRIALIGNRFPEALTERERDIWKIVCGSQRYWHDTLTGKPIRVSEKTFRFDNFRADLPHFDAMTRDTAKVALTALRKQRERASEWKQAQEKRGRK